MFIAKSGKTPNPLQILRRRGSPRPKFFSRSRSSRTVRNFFQPKFFGPKVGTADLFCREISLAENFPVRNLKITKIFGLKVEKSKKIWRESWKKRCWLAN